jgi:MtN3 and saliva related transmembrane protein
VSKVELIGWASSIVLVLTIGRQVYTQWRTHATAGVSKWLFVGQLTASTGFTIYSVMLHNWVYTASNAVLLVTAVLGEAIYLRNRRGQAPASA